MEGVTEMSDVDEQRKARAVAGGGSATTAIAVPGPRRRGSARCSAIAPYVVTRPRGTRSTRASTRST